MVLCTQNGLIRFLNKNKVPVKENVISKENYLTYHNNLLEFNSAKNFLGEPMIYDITGKLITKLDNQHFVTGKNIIRINQSLQRGVYILTIKVILLN